MKIQLLILFLFLSTSVFGQEGKKVIKVNPTSFLLKTLNIAYQKTNSSNSASQLRLYYTHNLQIDNNLISGYGISPEYMFYFGNKAPAGFYISPYVRYQKYKIEAPSCIGYSTAIVGGVVAGYQGMIKKVVTYEMFIGPNYGTEVNEANCSYSTPDLYEQNTGFWFRTGITLGAAW